MASIYSTCESAAYVARLRRVAAALDELADAADDLLEHLPGEEDDPEVGMLEGDLGGLLWALEILRASVGGVGPPGWHSGG